MLERFVSCPAPVSEAGFEKEGTVADKGTYEVFDRSYWRVWLRSRDGKPFVEACLDEMIGASSEIASKFSAAGRERMGRALLVAIIQLAAYSQSKEPSDMLVEVARRQSRQGLDIPPRLYDIFADSLVRVVARYDPRYTEATGAAWIEVLTPGLEYLKSHYDAPPDGTAA